MHHGTGLFTYMNGEKWPHSKGNGLLNIPIPWGIWTLAGLVKYYVIHPDPVFLGGGFQYFWNFHPEPWGNDPI